MAPDNILQHHKSAELHCMTTRSTGVMIGTSDKAPRMLNSTEIHHILGSGDGALSEAPQLKPVEAECQASEEECKVQCLQRVIMSGKERHKLQKKLELKNQCWPS